MALDRISKTLLNKSILLAGQEKPKSWYKESQCHAFLIVSVARKIKASEFGRDGAKTFGIIGLVPLCSHETSE